MVSLIVRFACQRSVVESRRLVDFLFQDPDPRKFHQAWLKPAPPSGLFLGGKNEKFLGDYWINLSFFNI